MSNHSKHLLGLFRLATIVVTSTVIQTRLQATPGPLLFTEDGSTLTLTVTIDGVPFGTVRTIIPNDWVWSLSFALPMAGEPELDQGWQTTLANGTKVDSAVEFKYTSLPEPPPGQPSPPIYSVALIETIDDSQSPPNGAPRLPNGTVAPFPDNPWFSGIEFLYVDNTAAVPDNTSTWILFVIGGLCMIAFSRFATTSSPMQRG